MTVICYQFNSDVHYLKYHMLSQNVPQQINRTGPGNHLIPQEVLEGTLVIVIVTTRLSVNWSPLIADGQLTAVKTRGQLKSYCNIKSVVLQWAVIQPNTEE